MFLALQAISCKLTGLESFEKDSRVLKALYDCALGKTCVADIDDRSVSHVSQSCHTKSVVKAADDSSSSKSKV